MWRSVLCGLVAAGILAGCSVGGGHAAKSEGSRPASSSTPIAGNLTPDAWAVEQVSRMRIPPRNLPPLTNVICQVKGRRASCVGTLLDNVAGVSPNAVIKRQVPVVFTVVDPPYGHLVPYCPPPPTP